jgi:antitoxin StbD
VAILNHNKPSAYLVPAEAFEALMEKLEDYELARIVEERKDEPTVKVSLDEL